QQPQLATFIDAMTEMVVQMETAPTQQREAMLAFVPTVTAIVRGLATEAQTEGSSALLSPWATALFSEELVGTAREELRWDGYQVFQDGRMYIVLVHPQRGPNSLAIQEATIPKLRRILGEVQMRFPDVRLSLTGEPVLDFDEMQQSQRDAIQATLLTLVLCGGLFAVGFKEWIRPLLATACLMLIVALSMGWATVSVGHLNIITITFAVMIIGLSIDLGIQLIARYEEERALGRDVATAIRQAVEHTGPALITAALTNAAAFFAMGLAGFRGVTELGIIAGGGMIIAVVVMLGVLPALLKVVRRQREATDIPAQAVAHRTEQFLLRGPGITCAVCAVVTLASLVSGWRIGFDYNVLNLQSRGLESVETELRLLGADAESTIFAAVVCDTVEETRAFHERLASLPSVATVHSIAEVIPTGFEEKAPVVREIQARLGDVRLEPRPLPDREGLRRALRRLRLRATRLAETMQAAGDTATAGVLGELAAAAQATREWLDGLPTPDVEPDSYVQNLERRFFGELQAQIDLLRQQNVERPMTVEDLPAEVRRMLIGESGKFLIRVFPRENIWEREPLVRFIRDIQQVTPKATGTPLGLYEFVELLKRGYRNAALWAFLVITVVIFLDFRSLLATVLTIVPLCVGMAWMLGGMAWLGLSFNPANIMTAPLIVGIGVAYGVYVMQRFRETGEPTFWGRSTGRAVILSALTTVVAFATLIGGSHRGIQSLGMVMSLGVSACLLAAMTLLPALLALARRCNWRI
ncbi:MAG: MMPL family transporter, partial [Verrucomicrobiae bacterium]|nr:MMPL family transporter [Verrucomicrobiae bacterium]